MLLWSMDRRFLFEDVIFSPGGFSVRYQVRAGTPPVGLAATEHSAARYDDVQLERAGYFVAGV